MLGEAVRDAILGVHDRAENADPVALSKNSERCSALFSPKTLGANEGSRAGNPFQVLLETADTWGGCPPASFLVWGERKTREKL